MQYPRGYLKRAFEMVREKGGVCISDEVQTGFGRTGDHFWGFQGHDVMPDIGEHGPQPNLVWEATPKVLSSV